MWSQTLRKYILPKLKVLSRSRWLRAILLFVVVGLGLDAAFPFHPKVPYSTQILAADGTVLHAFLSKDDKWRLQTEVAEITPLLRKTLIYKEDRFFAWHPGVNPLALGRAALRNLLTGRRTSGASTITMQVVRLLQPRKRTYGSKFVEILRAIQLELHYSKTQILQMYLNLVPYGGNIEGIKAASLLYFGKPPQLLSLAEITALAIVPNRPSSLRPDRRQGSLRVARNQWLRRFEKEKLFEKNIIEDALREPLDVKRRAAPCEIPHLALRLKSEFPDEPTIRTAIRPQKQRQVEELVKNYVNRLRSKNIHNAAVLVVNNETGAAEAYVGSADFANPYDGGQVDGIRAVRSPGSTLKPLLYATAFDKGLLTQKTVLNDVPTNFGGYEPENFDQRFNGPVTVEFALANSLNVPAVKILKDVSTPVLVEQLKKAGFQTVSKQSKDLGLSLILGGCGVTLEELTRLFAAFAREGKVRPLTFGSPTELPKKSKIKGSEIVSPGAAFLITNVLTQITRPDLPTNFDNTYHLPRIAWKTGTSYGRRDAWSVGYNKRYTVGVWVGNFSGQGVPELSGAETATPLLFSIFNSLDYNSPKGWYRAPDPVAVRQVCAASGDIPVEFCTNKIVDYHLMGVSPYRRCTHRKWVFTDVAGKVSYCPYCLPAEGYVRRSFPNLAPELISYYEFKKLPYEKEPPHNDTCERVFHDGAPMIVSPNQGSEYYLRTDEPQQLLLSCQAANNVEEVFWYVNDKLFQKSGPTEAVFMSPPPGRVKISCSDDKGRNTDIWIMVKRL
ncbi:penicillin-binding protein 1C [Persicitalea jodogahamensis]|uniref:peptidoglycan glycosyltransferase n=1 Tax=Persicitalea jodogahamensis TaxID=402147 RepID=A0A8J3D3I4_9BACT|nr:penicillin-binding protein 1C [Persicitalea jodogahamensis]GHB68137.1 penicillin-binding protein 1C [Persicitalea jodogahamensis]